MLDYCGTRNFLLFPDFKDKAVTLSYDDGLKKDERLIEIMNEHGLKGTFNLNSGYFLKERADLLTEEEAIKLYIPNGMEVAVHGHEHLSLSKIDSAMAVRDIIKDRSELEKLFKTVIKGMAYASGHFDNKSIEIVKKCGINYARTTVSTGKFSIPTDWLRLNPTTRNEASDFIDLAKDFLAPSKYERLFWFNDAKLYYLWGHAFEFNTEEKWKRMEEFAKLFDRRDDVWHATNGEVYDYVTAFDRLEFSAEGTFVYNPSAIDVFVKYYGNKKFLIPAGKTVALC